MRPAYVAVYGVGGRGGGGGGGGAYPGSGMDRDAWTWPLSVLP